MSKKTLLLIVGVVIILAAATTANAYYCEQWEFKWASGYITYDGTTYYLSTVGADGDMWCVENGHAEDDNTGDGQDYFPPAYDDWTVKFYSSGNRDSLVLSDATYSTYTTKGWKTTGQSGTKEGNGYWCAYDSVHDDYIYGTWNTGTINDSYKFDYNNSPPTIAILWYVTDAVNVDATGGGEGGGNRLQNQANCSF